MINLSKGQRIDLTKKDGSGLKNILVGLGWEEAGAAVPEKKGLLGLFKKAASAPKHEIDIDASVFLVGKDGKVRKDDVVYFGNKTHKSGAVVHQGDNLVGGTMNGMEDSEQINVDLSKVPQDIRTLAFVVNIYDCASRRQHFGMIRNAYIRIVDQDTKAELARYSLTDDYANLTSIIVGEASRTAAGWAFDAVGEGRHDVNINGMLRKYNG